MSVAQRLAGALLRQAGSSLHAPTAAPAVSSSLLLGRRFQQTEAAAAEESDTIELKVRQDCNAAASAAFQCRTVLLARERLSDQGRQDRGGAPPVDLKRRAAQVMEYKAHHIDPPSPTVTTTKAELMTFFETMYRMRRMEIAADMMYKAKFIRGFCHLCAPALPACKALGVVGEAHSAVVLK